MVKHKQLLWQVLTAWLAAVPLVAGAISFQTRVEHVEWQVEGDRFECRLSQPISGFGAGIFVRRAGEKTFLRWNSKEAWLKPGQAQLFAAAAQWQSAQADMPLGAIKVEKNERVAESDHAQGERLLVALLEGRSPVLRHETAQSEPLEVRVQPNGFAKGYSDFLACTQNLLPVNYGQIKQTVVRFDAGGYDLSEQTRRHLDVLLEYIGEDKSVNRILLDGHSDNSGDRLLNRDVSRRRALAVKAYLIAKGFPENEIIVRFHGERYPVRKNDSAANRAANRRVVIALERIDLEVRELMDKIGDNGY